MRSAQSVGLAEDQGCKRLLVQRPRRTEMPTYSRLTRPQRYTIEAMNRSCSPQKEIAETIEVSTSRVCRELRRNGITQENYSYVAVPNPTNGKDSGSPQNYWNRSQPSFVKSYGVPIKSVQPLQKKVSETSATKRFISIFRASPRIRDFLPNFHQLFI